MLDRRGFPFAESPCRSKHVFCGPYVVSKAAGGVGGVVGAVGAVVSRGRLGVLASTLATFSGYSIFGIGYFGTFVCFVTRRVASAHEMDSSCQDRETVVGWLS